MPILARVPRSRQPLFDRILTLFRKRAPAVPNAHVDEALANRVWKVAQFFGHRGNARLKNLGSAWVAARRGNVFAFVTASCVIHDPDTVDPVYLVSPTGANVALSRSEFIPAKGLGVTVYVCELPEHLAGRDVMQPWSLGSALEAGRTEDVLCLGYPDSAVQGNRHWGWRPRRDGLPQIQLGYRAYARKATAVAVACPVTLAGRDVQLEGARCLRVYTVPEGGLGGGPVIRPSTGEVIGVLIAMDPGPSAGAESRPACLLALDVRDVHAAVESALSHEPAKTRNYSTLPEWEHE